MIEIDIPSIDPIQHRPKIFLGLTSRQCICIVPGVGLGAGLFFLTNSFSTDLAVILASIAIAPAVCLGWIRPYNMNFEDYVKLVYYNEFVSNKKRIYKTDAEDVQKPITIKEREALAKKKKGSASALKKEKLNKKNNNSSQGD